jgi:hypothetical protein
MLGSWNGIGFADLSNGGAVRGAFSTRTGDMSISGSLTSSSISSSGVITCGSIVSGTIRSNTQIGVVNSAPWDHINISHDGSTAFFDAGGAEGGFAFRSTTSNSSYPSNIGYTERMRINGNGLVGINTASPVTYLHVYGSGDVASGILVENAQASDNASRNLLSGRFNASLAPSMSGPNLYLYASSGYTPYRCILSASTYFTGQHGNQPIETQSYLKTNVEDYIGLIVSSAGQGCYSINPMTKEVITGKKAICINEALPLIILTNKDKDKAVWGVITNVKNEAYNPDGTIDKDNNTQWGDRLDSMIRINGLGEGAVWVTNINGAIENGDLICSSIIPGYGRVQDDDLFHNYTVAKSTISCDFDLNNNDLYECVEFEHNGVIYKKAFIACTYHCS